MQPDGCIEADPPPTERPKPEELQRVMRLCERPLTTAIPGLNTFADQLALFAFHESYHVGQMAVRLEGPRLSAFGGVVTALVNHVTCAAMVGCQGVLSCGL